MSVHGELLLLNLVFSAIKHILTPCWLSYSLTVPALRPTRWPVLASYGDATNRSSLGATALLASIVRTDIACKFADFNSLRFVKLGRHRDAVKSGQIEACLL